MDEKKAGRVRVTAHRAARESAPTELPKTDVIAPATTTVEILITQQQGALIRSLLYTGLFGTDESEVAERLLAEALLRRFPKVVR